MRRLAIKSFLVVFAATLTLGVAAFAAATTGSDEPSPQPSSVALASRAATDDVSDSAAPTGSTLAGPAPTVPGEGRSKDEDTGASPNERTTAVNPAGHCVDLPDTSNIIGQPDKHPNWTIQPCELADDPASHDAEDPEDEPGARDGQHDDGSGPPEGRTPALNPDGVCIEMPNNSDVVRHPEKHPAWTVAGCRTSGGAQ